MKKKVIRLTEGDLRQMIEESINEMNAFQKGLGAAALGASMLFGNPSNTNAQTKDNGVNREQITNTMSGQAKQNSRSLSRNTIQKAIDDVIYKPKRLDYEYVWHEKGWSLNQYDLYSYSVYDSNQKKEYPIQLIMNNQDTNIPYFMVINGCKVPLYKKQIESEVNNRPTNNTWQIKNNIIQQLKSKGKTVEAEIYDYIITFILDGMFEVDNGNSMY